MKKYLILIIGLALVGLVGYYGWQWNDSQMNRPPIPTSTPNGKTVQISGNLLRNNPGMKENVWYLVYDEPGSPALKAEIKFSGASECLRGQVALSCVTLDLPNGTRVTALGTKEGDVLTVEKLNIETPEEAVKVTSPTPNERITSAYEIKGEARGNWFFEASFPIRLFVEGKVVTTAIAVAQGDWMTTGFVPFKSVIAFNVATDTLAELVFAADNPSGLPQFDKEMRLPVTLAPRSATRTVDLYFYNAQKDTDANGNIICSSKGLVQVKRTTARTQSPLTDAVKLLLKGPTEEEKSRGATSEFPLEGVELQSAVIKNGTATLTFKDPNFRTGGGSCRVAVLWAQIEATARQFPGIKEVKFAPQELFQP